MTLMEATRIRGTAWKRPAAVEWLEVDLDQEIAERDPDGPATLEFASHSAIISISEECDLRTCDCWIGRAGVWFGSLERRTGCSCYQAGIEAVSAKPVGTHFIFCDEHPINREQVSA